MQQQCEACCAAVSSLNLNATGVDRARARPRQWARSAFSATSSCCFSGSGFYRQGHNADKVKLGTGYHYGKPSLVFQPHQRNCSILDKIKPLCFLLTAAVSLHLLEEMLKY